MFTGLIGEIGRIESLDRSAGATGVTVRAPGLTASGLRPGDSVAVDGICLTVTRLDARSFQVTAVDETAALTTLSGWRSGKSVNLERALALGDRLDGHLVTGHVDGVAKITAIVPEGQARRVRLSAPGPLGPYLARKGSVALDGVSLTIAGSGNGEFSVVLIPFTQARTTLGAWAPGQGVNLEVDVVARYVERLQTGRLPDGGLTWERLRSAGF
jgi:riboflavin synthase